MEEQPPHERTHLLTTNDVVASEYVEMVPPISTVDRHKDLPKHVVALPHHGALASPAELRHHQELNRGDVAQLEAKVEAWRTHGRPRHPIWQYFAHEHASREHSQHSPHLSVTHSEEKDVACALCGAHIHQRHRLRKGEVEAVEEIKVARSVLHGMWDHLATECPRCPENVRHDMKTWHPLPKETLATPAAPVSPTQPLRKPTVVETEETTAQATTVRTGEVEVVEAEQTKVEPDHARGGDEDEEGEDESVDSTTHLLGSWRSGAP